MLGKQESKWIDELTDANVRLAIQYLDPDLPPETSRNENTALFVIRFSVLVLLLVGAAFLWLYYRV